MRQQILFRLSIQLLLAVTIAVAALALPTHVGVAQPGEVEAQPWPGKEPSKIPDLVRQRIERIAHELQAAPQLSPGIAKGLDATVAGGLELEFHAAGPVGDAEAASLEALGATILTSTADISWPTGGPPPGLGVVVARIPFDQVEAAAALPWVVAVRAVEDNPPDIR
jgi:hypothetical protein